MSLLRPIIRACAVGALRDRTWAGAQVYDSDMTPFADAVVGKAATPYVICYTDADDWSPVRGIAEIYEGDNRSLSVILEIGVASAVQQQNGNIIIHFSETDQGMEWAVDTIAYQAMGALIGDPSSKWGELFKRFTYKLKRVSTRRGGQAGGIRFAARRITLLFSTVWDLIPGVVPASTHPVWKFIDMAGSDSALGLSGLATIVQQMLTQTNTPSWRQAQAMLGVTTSTAVHLNVPGVPLPWPGVEDPPLDWSDKDEFVPPLTEIDLSITPFVVWGQPVPYTQLNTDTSFSADLQVVSGN